MASRLAFTAVHPERRWIDGRANVSANEGRLNWSEHATTTGSARPVPGCRIQMMVLLVFSNGEMQSRPSTKTATAFCKQDNRVGLLIDTKGKAHLKELPSDRQQH